MKSTGDFKTRHVGGTHESTVGGRRKNPICLVGRMGPQSAGDGKTTMIIPGALVRCAFPINKNMLLIGTRGEEVNHVELRFLARNFKHLTGVKTVSRKLEGNQFWRMCVNHRISERDLEFDRNGVARQKLNVAERAFEPGTCFRGFGVPNGVRRHVDVDLFAGSTRVCMGFENFEACYLDPKTLLDSPINREVLRNDMFKVVGVYSKSILKDSYGKASFIDRKADWGLVRESLPEALRYVVELAVQSVER